MSYVLFPGRHLINTTFQADYLRTLASRIPSAIPQLINNGNVPRNPVSEILFLLTSANQDNSRYNPIPFHIRAIGVDRFARELCSELGFKYRIFGIPHYGHTDNFAAFTLKEIVEQSEGAVRPNPGNCIVLCSTPEVINLYAKLGFAIAPAEKTVAPKTILSPIDIVRRIAECGEAWPEDPAIRSNLSQATRTLFQDFPEIPRRVTRIYRDPLTNEQGSLTESRNYNTYARGMNSIIEFKYSEIRTGILPGRIVDEGCADGALLAAVSREFPDSDLLGIDISAEFAHRFQERQRSGEFGGAYVHFFLRNLLDRIFEEASIDTTICNSTLHELWSYADGEETVRKYLSMKFQQLRPGGHLVIRDVVGPEDPQIPVLLECCSTDGKTIPTSELASISDRKDSWLMTLSTASRFRLFVRDFLPQRKRPNLEAVEAPSSAPGTFIFETDLKTAAEFLSKKDYTDNWSSEMHEEFCFWSFPKWKQVLKEIGFIVLENPNQPEKGSRCYTNPWIVENRYKGRVRILKKKNDDVNEIPFPPTHMVIVAKKPI